MPFGGLDRCAIHENLDNLGGRLWGAVSDTIRRNYKEREGHLPLTEVRMIEVVGVDGHLQCDLYRKT